MTKTELLNKLARDGEERLLLARVLDKLELAWDRGVPSHTGFLSPHERAVVEGLIRAEGWPRHLFFGGFADAERTVCAFLPDWLEEEDWLAGQEYDPIRALRCTWTGGSLTHRDFLGSILGLGLDREKVGDLLVRDGVCDVLVLEDVADFLLLHLEQAGRVHLKVSSISLEMVSPPPVQVRTIRDTVSSLRLDAVASSGFSISRGKAADLISSGKVQLNHQECLKPDRPVNEGDTLSCRGFGKCVVKEVGGPSKKGRIMIVLERYV
ncbi:RNA-binding protein [Flavonifractor sp. HCP28S3_F3]|uniref:YlmH family RNA-binding protein n=1 Tax=Flavonifractor sp. HCP28S3_F3 TaxID=3438939 RepID=UPI003F8A5C04